MKHVFFPLAGLCFLLFGCSGSSDHTVADQQATAITSACYAYESAKDTVRLQLSASGDSVRGRLVYHFSEKDRNSGTFQGQMSGDTLLAEYTFQSEGVTSVRQVAFLKTEDGFLEGYGNVAEKNGRMMFTDPKALQFAAQMPLRRTDCR